MIQGLKRWWRRDRCEHKQVIMFRDTYHMEIRYGQEYRMAGSRCLACGYVEWLGWRNETEPTIKG